jgi:divalent metal cation (Fe/Co/Zn/Cd) transporter
LSMRAITRNQPSKLFYLAALSAVFLLIVDFGVGLLLTNAQQQLIYSDLISPFVDFLATAALFFAAKQSFRFQGNLGSPGD